MDVLADDDVLRIALFGDVDVFLANFSLNVGLQLGISGLNDDLARRFDFLLDHGLFALERDGRFLLLESLRQNLILSRAIDVVIAINDYFLASKLDGNVHSLGFNDLLQPNLAGLDLAFPNIDRLFVERHYHPGVGLSYARFAAGWRGRRLDRCFSRIGGVARVVRGSLGSFRTTSPDKRHSS